MARTTANTTEATVRVELEGALAGRHILVRPAALTFGLLEDMQGDNISGVLNSLALAIAGGDLPKGTDRNGLRALVVPEIVAVIAGVMASFRLAE